MEQKHRDLIARNFSSLVEQTDIDQLVPILLEKGVFSSQMIDPYLDQTKDKRTRKRRLFRDIETRGPHAFGKLIEALNEIGQWDLVRMLEPSHSLHGLPKYQYQVISIKESKLENQTPAIPKPEPVPIEPCENADKKDEISSLNVTKSLEFMDNDPHILCYNTKSRKRGVLFMINNIQFDNDVEDVRHGALADQKNLESLFRQIGFHEFVFHVNLTAQKMEDAIKDFTKSDYIKRTDCVFIVIASHGFNKYKKSDTDIRGTDGRTISAMSVLEQFNNIHCESLQNIPKVFIFQMCRGNAPDYGFWTDKEIQRVKKVEIDGGGHRSANTPLRTYSDMLIAHSTIPGFASHRDADSGSWYVQAMCEIFAEHSNNRHVVDLFNMVDAKLRDNQHFTKQTSSVDNWGFNKHLYLHPGLFKQTNKPHLTENK